VWSDNFDRELKDIFAVQDEIAGLIAKQLSLKLGTSSAASKASVNPEAFELYAQARLAWNLRTPAGLDRAEDLLSRALTLEPNFARAHAALADVWLIRGSLYTATIGAFEQRGSAEFARIEAKVRQALALDSDAAESHTSLASLNYNGWNFAVAERELRRAIALNPNYASAHQLLGRVLESEGQMDDALVELKLATEIDPLSPVIAANYGGRLYDAGRFSEAIRVVDRSLVLQPGNTAALSHKADALVGLGRVEEAVAVIRQLVDQDVTNRFYQIRILAAAGMRDEANALLAGYPEKTRHPISIALLALGRREDALARLDAQSFTSSYIGRIMGGADFDPIRGEPRFVQFLATLGLTEAHVRAQTWRKVHPPEKPTATK
jgi:serine/threonine-protein kinase